MPGSGLPSTGHSKGLLLRRVDPGRSGDSNLIFYPSQVRQFIFLALVSPAKPPV